MQEYEEVREDHYENLREKRYLPLEKARAQRPKMDWRSVEIVRPSFLGTRTFTDYDLESLLPYIGRRKKEEALLLKQRRHSPVVFNENEHKVIFRDHPSKVPIN